MRGMNLRGLRMVPALVLVPLLYACQPSPDPMVLSAAAAEEGVIPAPSGVEAPPENAERSESGLAWIVLTEGDGATMPDLDDAVSVHYSGWQTDGTMFDSSVLGGAPATFQVGGVISGWTETLQMMTPGEERRVWIPADLAYGDPASRPGAPAGTLVFDMKLLEIIPVADTPPS